MLAFTNTEVTKEQLIASLEAHAAADRIRAGKYWGNNKGCAVGCSIHDFRPGAESLHTLYEPLFGIPEVLARLEDGIFERLPADDQQKWPRRFTAAIRVGADLAGVWDRFALWLLLDPRDGVIRHCKTGTPEFNVVTKVGELYRRKVGGDNPTRNEWQSAAAAADAAHIAAHANAANATNAANAAANATNAANAADYAELILAAAYTAHNTNTYIARANARAANDAYNAAAAYAAYNDPNDADAAHIAAHAASAAHAARANARAARANARAANARAATRQAEKLIELISAC